MIKKVTAFMQRRRMVQAGDHICIGVSGGADSVCLFRILECLRQPMGFTMSVVHVEHGIRGEESLEDMHFVNQLAKRYDVPFTACSYPVEQMAKARGLSVEEMGRQLRYQAFASEGRRFQKEADRRGGSVKIAVAHHADDNAETVLFHLCRGSGVDGLAGIRPVRGNIIRPLLCVGREEIEFFLQEIAQSYRTDATNADLVYSRNRIRNRILPELARINARAAAHINAVSEDATEVSEYLQNQADQILKKHMFRADSGQIRFEIAGFFEYPSILQRRVLLGLLAQASGSKKDLTREHTNALLDLAKGRTGRRVSLPYGVIVEKTYGALRLDFADSHIGTPSVSVPLDFSAGETESFWQAPTGSICCRILEIEKIDGKIPKNQYTKWFDYDKIKNRLYLRTRKPGDYFILDANGHRQKLKDYWINEKTPKDRRDRILLLADGSHILWIIGYRISEHYKVARDTKRILEVQFMEEKA